MRANVSASHLERRACVYVRQSTAQQVFHHGESTNRQYALADRAAALGWARESIDIIDEDQGRSGSTTDGRGGFARLVEDVARGKVGAVLAVEVSRLARSSQDWQRLLSLCAVAETVVVDEQAIYDPGDKDDKLLLDIKGTMSEAELHWLGLRMIGALRSKARRGELRVRPPTGYVWTEAGLAFDPDEAVQRAVRLVFERFAIEPSGAAVASWANAAGVSVPTRQHHSDGTSELEWRPLGAHRVYEMLRNPTYAGVYTYGRRPVRKVLVDGEIRHVRADGDDPDKWAVRIDNAHPGYIDWETYVKNQQKLRDNQLLKHRATRGAPRDGSALLTGLLLCGRCGRRMDVTYRSVDNGCGYYRCRGDWNYGKGGCWTVPADPIDRAVEKLFLEAMAPAELDVSLAVEYEIGEQAEAIDRHWKLRIEQATYETKRAERRYKAVDPDNRVVARTLEREWEERLRDLDQVQKQLQQARQQHHVELTDADRARIRALSRDLPNVWKSSSTSQADRKAMLRLVIEAISITPIDVPKRATRIRVAWTSGASTQLDAPRPPLHMRTPRGARERAFELASSGLTNAQIADQLNAEGMQTGAGRTWTATAVGWARQRRGQDHPGVADGGTRVILPDQDASGRYSVPGAARCFGVSRTTVRGWIADGVVTAERAPYRGRCGVWWITIDDATARLLRQRVAQKGRLHRKRRARSPRVDRRS